jgi:NADP-dependent 3-hydroxy acid dehydrogenase YdfG
MANEFNDQVALVTGASSGIGRATAIALVEAGFRVALVARNLERLLEASRELPADRSVVIAQDLTEFDQLADLVQTVETKLGPVDLLVNNAGIAYVAPLEQMPLSDWNQVMALNLTVPLALAQQVLPGMRQRKRGTIINIVSIAGQRTFPHWGAYCASKFGLLAFSRTLAEEVRGDGIRVTALCPGSVDTALWDSEHVKADFDRSAMLSADSVARLVVWATSLPPEAVLEEATLMPNRGAF